VGKETVERLITETRTESRKTLVNGVAAVLAVVAVVAGVFIFKGQETEKKIEAAKSEAAATASKVEAASSQAADTAKTVKAMKDVMTPKEIAAAYGASTVYIEVAWRLIDPVSGQPLYHLLWGSKPAYFGPREQELEPVLTPNPPKNGAKPMGGELSGSGFAVLESGFILTSRHVAAPWKAYQVLKEGVWLDLDDKQRVFVKKKVDAFRWYPEKSVWCQTTRKGEQKPVAGRHDRLDITFANTRLRIPARLARVAEEHDVALIKADTPAKINPAPLAGEKSWNEVKPGDPITVLGYPGVSPKLFVAGISKDMLDPGGVSILDTPVPTVTPGAIGKLLRGTGPAPSGKYDYYSGSYDSYQLTVNATGPGNSGGPVFDDHGRVIGIFYATDSDKTISFAVPIKFVKELMEVKAEAQ